ncbi:MAG: FecCD family ABC transporter permease [Flavobacteriales bacterium]
MNRLSQQYTAQRRKSFLLIFVLACAVPVLFLLDLFLGSVPIPFSEVVSVLTGGTSEKEAWNYIILDTRLPQSLTAVSAGAALACGGLLLQTFFRNPLAGPDVMGISSGAMLGVAIVFMGGDLLGMHFSGTLSGFLQVFSAMTGAIVVLVLVVFLSGVSRDGVTVIIGGLMIAYLAGALVNLLQHAAAREGLQQFVFWGFGSFSGMDLYSSLRFSALIIVVLIPSFFLTRSLNAWVLGPVYAQSVGVPLKKFRLGIIVSSGMLTAIVTAYCGPIAFIGIAVPHLVRWVIRTEDHSLLLPAVVLLGAALSLFCSLITRLPVFETPLPLNAITSLVGAPVVLIVILKQRHKGSFV